MSVNQREYPIIKGEDTKRFLENEDKINKKIEEIKNRIRNKMPEIEEGFAFSDDDMKYFFDNAESAIIAFAEIVEENYE